jgi:insulysin
VGKLLLGAQKSESPQLTLQRFFQMEKHVFREDHPYHKFGTGNYDSLWSKPKADGRDPRQQLIDWWKKYYCARRMKLAVTGKEDVDVLEKWVRERFERVRVTSEGAPPVGTEGVRIAFDESPMGPEQMGVS